MFSLGDQVKMASEHIIKRIKLSDESLKLQAEIEKINATLEVNGNILAKDKCNEYIENDQYIQKFEVDIDNVLQLIDNGSRARHGMYSCKHIKTPIWTIQLDNGNMVYGIAGKTSSWTTIKIIASKNIINDFDKEQLCYLDSKDPTTVRKFNKLCDRKHFLSVFNMMYVSGKLYQELTGINSIWMDKPDFRGTFYVTKGRVELKEWTMEEYDLFDPNLAVENLLDE